MSIQSKYVEYLTEFHQKLNDEINQEYNESNSNLNALETLKLVELLVVSSDKVYKTPQLLSLIRKGIENEEKFKS